MTDPARARASLLPAGLADGLPPDAEHEARVRERLLAHFARQGYARVKPPMVEFEENLLRGAGAGLAQQTFRLMDPHSQRMMALRSDMTPQIGRIAATRLAHEPRPLRLSYAGEVLRVRGSQLRPERQFGQVGAELIGAAGVDADAEIVLLVVEALAELGVADLSVDLTLPALPDALIAALGAQGQADELRAALERRDAAGLRAVGGAAAEMFGLLLTAAGPAGEALPRLKAAALPAGPAAALARLVAVSERLLASGLPAQITVDPVEMRGFRYQTGVSFTLFAAGVRGELGRGGRYDAQGEAASGASVYMDTLLRALPAPGAVSRVYLPLGTPLDVGRGLRAQGWQTVAALEGSVDPAARDLNTAARRQGCDHVYRDGQVVPVAAISGD